MILNDKVLSLMVHRHGNDIRADEEVAHQHEIRNYDYKQGPHRHRNGTYAEEEVSHRQEIKNHVDGRPGRLF